MSSVIRAFSFEKAYRLRHRREFDVVFRHARKIKSGFLTVLFMPNELGVPRLGLVVAKRFIHEATMRNRLKRLLREAFRHEKSQIGAYDLVIMVNKGEAAHQSLTWRETVSKMMMHVTQIAPNTPA